MPAGATTRVERNGRSTVVHLHGDLVVANARRLYGRLRTVARRRDVKTLILDFADAGRVDSSGVAVISLVRRQLARTGKQLDLKALDEHHRAALAEMPEATAELAEPNEMPGVMERIGDHVLIAKDGAVALGKLIGEVVTQGFAVLTRKKKLPAGSLFHQVSAMGVDAVFIVGLLSFLLGMTMAFQGAVQLQRFGASVFVADMIGLSMVREIGPLMIAIILTGRTGAAIAAELGTMRVRSEIDALETMGINPVRFLILPRMLGITIAGPALALLGMFIGIFGGMLVASVGMDLPAITFWSRLVERLSIGDFAHGIVKSLIFAWIIGLTGSHLGLRASGDASSVGTATTRTVVVSIFFIIVVDAVFATVATILKAKS